MSVQYTRIKVVGQRFTESPEVIMSDSLISAILHLTEYSAEASFQSLDEDYNAVSKEYNFLCNRILSMSSPDLRNLSTQIKNFLDRCSTRSLGAFFLDAALFRSCIHNHDNWIRVGMGAVVPSPQLLDALDDHIVFAKDKSSPFHYLYKGVRRFIVGDDVGAFENFANSQGDPLYWGAIRDDLRGSATCRPFPNLSEQFVFQHPHQLRTAEDRFPSPTGKLEWLVPASVDKSSRVISVSCDDLYFRAFSPRIVESLPDECKALNIHFHIVNPSEAVTAAIAHLQAVAAQKLFKLIVSAERTETLDRAYFACARFIRLHEFLAEFRAPMLLIDADSEFVSDPQQWIGLLEPAAINMLFVKGPWSGGIVPWRMVWAGMIYVPPIDEGMLFAKVLQEVIGYLWNKGKNTNWWVDQNSLYVTYRLFQRYWGPEGFRNIRPEVYQQLRTGEELKIAGLQRLPEVEKLMAGGKNWTAALEQLQISRP